MFRQGITSFKGYLTYPAMMIGDEQMFYALQKMKEYGGILGVRGLRYSRPMIRLTIEATARIDPCTRKLELFDCFRVLFLFCSINEIYPFD